MNHAPALLARLLFAFSTAGALAIPRLVSYQGRLTDTLGRPAADTTHEVTFRLYEVPAGGTPFWNETQTIRTRAGLFSALLGSVVPIGSMPDAGSAYLGMTVAGGEELVPRLRIASAAYAFKADTAAYARVAPGGDNAWARGIPDSVLFTVKQLGITRGGAANALHGSSRHTHTNFGNACTTGTPGQDYGFGTVGGGFGNDAAGSYNTIGGGLNNHTADDFTTVAGGSNNRALVGYATVAGGQGNSALAGDAAIGGGKFNTARGMNATIAGGKYNTANGYCSAIGGGVDNVAESVYATIAGGSGNAASGHYAAVGGGFGNTASGVYAAVPGGVQNRAAGTASLAAGRFARAGHAGSFVWSDSAQSEAESVYTTGGDQFRVRARGGTWFFTDAGMTAGTYLAAGSNSWAAVCDSANKTDFRDVDRQELLRRVAALRVASYRLKSQSASVRHIGPVAQDFRAAFGVGETGTTINQADADGVLLAAVQALYEQNQGLRAEVEELKAALRRR